MAVLQVWCIFLGEISFPLAPGVRKAGAGAVLPTADFPGRLETLQVVRQQADSSVVLSGGVGMLPGLCVCPVPGCLGVWDLCMMAV